MCVCVCVCVCVCDVYVMQTLLFIGGVRGRHKQERLERGSEVGRGGRRGGVDDLFIGRVEDDNLLVA